MSLALYPTTSLRFWSEKEILLRNQFTARILDNIRTSLLNVNSAWRFEQCEGPILTPIKMISSSYDGDDVFILQEKVANEISVLRPETTPSSYVYAEHLLKATSVKPPLCVWQLGKSFRRETSDGATAPKLRFNEFYQLEFQCIYRKNTKANYRDVVLIDLATELGNCSNQKWRIVESDRLPSYSIKTDDIELYWAYENGFKEVASVSTRTDFPKIGEHEYEVLEIAVGMDRLICMTQQKI